MPATWINKDSCVYYKHVTEEDRWITPHIPELIDQLNCHIYVDVVFTVSVFTYLYKYLYKGPNHALFCVFCACEDPVNEIKDYIDARYLSVHEAAWCILGFHITSKTPSVSCQPIHLPDENIARYTGTGAASMSTTLLLIHYFCRPNIAQFATLKYCDYFKDFMLFKWNETNELQADKFLE